MSDTFEEAKTFRLMFDGDVRDMKANTLIGGEIRGERGRHNDLHTLLTESLLPLRALVNKNWTQKPKN